MAENFVVNKRKPQNQSMNKLKEDYATELAELVRMIPGLQKQLADLQERLIAELYTIFDDTITIGKVEIDSRTCKAHELRCFLEQNCGQALSVKSSCIPQVNKGISISQGTQGSKS